MLITLEPIIQHPNLFHFLGFNVAKIPAYVAKIGGLELGNDTDLHISLLYTNKLKKMKVAYIIKRETAYISNNTGEIVAPSFEERMLDHYLASRQYHFVELFSKVAEVKAKTLRELNENAWKVAEKNQLGYDFFLHIIK